MGRAGGSTSTIVCTQSAEIIKPSISSKRIENSEYDTRVTTLSDLEQKLVQESLHKAAKTHDDELTTLRTIGSITPILPNEIGTDFNFNRKIVWKNAFGFLLLHLLGVCGLLLGVFGFCDIRTSLYSIFVLYISGQGVTMGAHRLWAHRAFKAALWLKIFLLWCHTLAGQNCLWVWVRDHRQHHKYSDTDADPHNANRGFFFSHVGWLMSRKHPKVKEYGKKIDMSDIEADPWIMFQKRHYKILYTIFALILPTIIPILAWKEDPFLALMVSFFGRTIFCLNVTWCVNSAAHLWGTRPYDKTMFPVENMLLSLFAGGEGWHNYHHAFPWDYRASELGTPLNSTGFLIDIFANFGATWDLKEATHNMVKHRVMRTGDNSHHTYGNDEGRNAIKTLFNIWKHPLNPTYNSIYKPQPKSLKQNGYALIEEELKRSPDSCAEIINTELDCSQANGIQKYIVDKKEADKILGNLSKYINNTNGNVLLETESVDSSSDELTINNNVRQRKLRKEELDGVVELDTNNKNI